MTELQTTWNWMIAVYLFLGGLGAGAACTTAIIGLTTGERFKKTMVFGTWAAAIILGMGALLLVLDTAQPLRAMIMPISFVHFSSWMTIGAWLLLAAIILNGLAALFWTDKTTEWLGRLWKPFSEKRKVWRTVFLALALPVSFGVAVYTGILLGVLPFRPLWHTWLLPVLFTVSAMDTGVALVTGHAFFREKGEGSGKLRLALEIAAILLIVTEAVVLYLFLNRALTGTPDAARSAQVLTEGVLSPYFWILVVAIGLGVPLVACFIQLTGLHKVLRKAAGSIPLVAAISCLLGGLTLRFMVVMAGLPISLSSPVWEQIREGVRFIP